jgi:hypothetical protein
MEHLSIKLSQEFDRLVTDYFDYTYLIDKWSIHDRLWYIWMDIQFVHDISNLKSLNLFHIVKISYIYKYNTILFSKLKSPLGA